jgi:hypothetical protein
VVAPEAHITVNAIKPTAMQSPCLLTVFLLRTLALGHWAKTGAVPSSVAKLRGP